MRERRYFVNERLGSRSSPRISRNTAAAVKNGTAGRVKGLPVRWRSGTSGACSQTIATAARKRAASRPGMRSAVDVVRAGASVCSVAAEITPTRSAISAWGGITAVRAGRFNWPAPLRAGTLASVHLRIGRACMKSSLASVTVCALLASSAVARAQAPFPLASDPRIDPSKLRVTTFASGIPYPTGVQRLDDGSMLVAVNDPTGGRFYSSTGKLLRLTDVNHDGVADDAGTYVNTNLPGSIVQMRQAGDLLIVNSAPASGPSTINILRRGATPTSPYTNVGSLSFTWPTNQSHKTYGLAVRRSEIVGPPTYHVYFNVGSRLNAANDFATVPMTSTVAGLSNSSLQPESIYQF